MMTDAFNTLFPYRRTSWFSSRLCVAYDNDAVALAYETCKNEVIGWCLIIDNHIDMDVFKSTREEAEIALDQILIDRGYRLLTEEEAEKVRLLL